jgi:hypothetical protein
MSPKEYIRVQALGGLNELNSGSRNRDTFSAAMISEADHGRKANH